MLKRILNTKGAVGFILLAVAAYLAYHFFEARKHNAAQIEKKQPKQDMAQNEPKIHVKEDVAPPAVVLSNGTGVDYRSVAPAPGPAIPPMPISEATPQPEVQDLPPMVLCDFAPPTPAPTPTPVPVPKAKPVQRWLPRGVYFRVETQGALTSSHMDTPVQVVVTEDVYQWDDYGRAELIIPAGTRCSSFASQGYVRDCIEVKGNWIMVFHDTGLELEFTGILCEQEFDPRLNQFGKLDKTAGLKGKLIESDSYVRLKAALGLVLQTAADSASSFAASALQTSMRGGTSVSYNVPSTTPFTNEWIEQLVNGHHTAINDSLYVWIPSGHQGWIFTTSVIDPAVASIGARIQEEEKARKQKEEQQEQRNQYPLPLDPVNLKRMLLQTANQQTATPAEQSNTSPTNETPPVSAAHFN